jgi:hypothetical protein
MKVNYCVEVVTRQLEGPFLALAAGVAGARGGVLVVLGKTVVRNHWARRR